jgi:6-phosphofructokinase 2
LGLEDLKMDDVAKVAQEFIERGKCEVMVVSLGADGAMLVSKNLVKTVRPPKVEKHSTVGAGDSMVAGMVWYLSQGHNLDEVLQFGVACGTAATMNPGSELCKKTDAEHLYKLIRT